MKLKTPYLILGVSLWQFLLFVSVFSVFEIHFQSIKDVEILLNLSAKLLSDAPNRFVFHTHILISQLLESLYVFSKKDWYSYFLLAVLGISFVSINFKILQTRQNWKGVLFVVLGSLLLQIPILTQLNFEVVAGISAIAGAIIILPKEFNKINIARYLFGFLLLLLAFLLSSSAFILSGIPCFLFVFSQTNRKYFNQIILKLFVLMMLVLVTIGSDWYNKNAYHDKQEWHIFREMQELSQKLRQIDIKTCNQDPDCEAVLAKLEWTLNDFRILQNGFIYPNATFSNYKIKTFIQEAHLEYSQKHRIEDTNHELLINKNYNYLIISSLAIFLFALLLCIQNYRRALKILFFGVFIFALSLLSIYFFNISKYLLSPLWVLLAVLPLFWSIPQEEVKTTFELKKLNRFQLVSLSFLTMLILVQITATLFNQRAKSENISSQFIDEVLVKNTSKNLANLYILWETDLSLIQLKPFEKLPNNQKNIFWLHNYQQSPALKSRLDNYQVEDLYKNLVEKKNLFLVIDNEKFNALSKIYKLYISEHYDLLIQFERQNKESEKYGIYGIGIKK